MTAADPQQLPRGRFITFEGLDGAGKSTHVEWFASALKKRTGRTVIVTREPGGTTLGEALRQLVLHEPMHLETETLLMFAARRQHLADVILPGIECGDWVVCDRFTDATFAYQGGGRGLSLEKIAILETWVHPGFEPDLTVFFDVSAKTARARLDAARTPDRFERQDEAFFLRVRVEYLRRAEACSSRFVMVDGERNVSEIRQQLEEIIVTRCI